jgi:hypothetical protein
LAYYVVWATFFVHRCVPIRPKALFCFHVPRCFCNDLSYVLVLVGFCMHVFIVGFPVYPFKTNYLWGP